MWGNDVCLLSRVLPDSMCDVVGTSEGTPSVCVGRYAGKYVDLDPEFTEIEEIGI